MKPLVPQPDWPESWKLSYHYDRLELYGDRSHRGYALGYAARRKATLALVASAARPPARVLDLAAAQGNFSLALAELGYDVTWNDLRGELEGYVRLKHEKGSLRFAPGNVFELGNVEPFDLVLMTEVLEHVAHPDDFLRRVSGLVKPGGHIVMTTPNGEYVRNTLPRFSDCPDPSIFEERQFQPDGDGHIFLLHEDELKRLSAAAGLKLESLNLFANLLTSGHMKLERLLRILPESWVQAIEESSLRLPWPLRKKLHVGFAALLAKA